MTKIDPIEKSLWVPLPPAQASVLFTEKLETWWPVETHSLSAGQKSRPQAMVFEPRLGGQITETLPDGTVSNWAEVMVWNPPHSFELAWHVGRDRAQASRVKVAFRAENAGTQLHLLHDGFDALGAEAAESAENYRNGWVGVLARYEAATKPH